MKNFKKILTILAIFAAESILAETESSDLGMPSKEQQEENIKSANSWRSYMDEKHRQQLDKLETAIKADDDEQLSKMFTSDSWPTSSPDDLLKTALNAPVLNYDAIQLLIDNGATLYDHEIYHLIEAENIEFIQFLIDHCIIVCHYGNEYSFAPNGSGFEWIMKHAIKHQSFKILNFLFDNNYLSIEVKDKGLWDAVPCNNSNDSYEMVKFLLEHGARVTDSWCLTNANPELLKLLMQYSMPLPIKQEALENITWDKKLTFDFAKLMIEHGAQPTSYLLKKMFEQNRLDIAELFLQHPAITTEIKNLIINDAYDDLKLNDTKINLLLKYGAKISEHALIRAISAGNFDKIKLYLESGATVATDQALSIAAATISCPEQTEKIIKLLIDHGASIPLAEQRKLLYNSQSPTIEAKLKAEIDQTKKRIESAVDLTDLQKRKLLKEYEKCDFVDVLRYGNDQCLTKFAKLDIPDKLLLKYFPLGLWTNYQQHEKSKKIINQTIKDCDLFQIAPDPVTSEYLRNLQTKKNLTATELLLINLAKNRQTLGENTFLSGKDPKDKSGVWGYDKDKNYYASGFAGDILKSKMIDKITQAERKLGTQGFETFFHGRAWEWNFVNDVWNMLCALKKDSYQPDKISLRFRNENPDIAELLDYRQKLVAKGADYHIGTGTDKTGKESEVTFMNKTIISNPGYYGECTGTYFVDNCSVSGNRGGWTFVEKIFAQQGLKSYFDAHKQELEALYGQHAQTSKIGELLCIAVKKDLVDQMVYPAKSGGFKTNMRTSTNGQTPPNSFNPITNSASSSIKQLKQLALTGDKFIDTGHMFYCFAVSDIPGEYGDKYVIKSLNLANPEKYGAYVQARQAFFEKMKAEVATNAAKTGAGNENL
jgi:ankyrin repeat protein